MYIQDGKLVDRIKLDVSRFVNESADGDIHFAHIMQLNAAVVNLQDKIAVNAIIKDAMDDGATDIMLIDRDLIRGALHKWEKEPVKGGCCPDCYARLLDGWNFCYRCGKRVAWKEERHEQS